MVSPELRCGSCHEIVSERDIECRACHARLLNDGAAHARVEQNTLERITTALEAMLVEYKRATEIAAETLVCMRGVGVQGEPDVDDGCEWCHDGNVLVQVEGNKVSWMRCGRCRGTGKTDG